MISHGQPIITRRHKHISTHTSLLARLDRHQHTAALIAGLLCIRSGRRSSRLSCRFGFRGGGLLGLGCGGCLCYLRHGRVLCAFWWKFLRLFDIYCTVSVTCEQHVNNFRSRTMGGRRRKCYWVYPSKPNRQRGKCIHWAEPTSPLHL